MNELYWITRFDAISTLLIITMVFGWVAVAIFSISYYINNGQAIFEESRNYSESRVKEYRGYANTCIKGLKYSIPLTVLNTLLMVFTPTTKEALLIYGVGSTIDYLQANPTAKQLPDKCINALDRWVDTWAVEEKKEKKKED